MANEAVNGRAPAGTTTVAGFVAAGGIALASGPAEQALLDWLESSLAAEAQLGHDGTTEWKYRSAYELLAAYGRLSERLPMQPLGDEMSGDFDDSTWTEGFHDSEAARSRRVERIGWVAIAVVLTLGFLVVLAILAGILLFSVAAASVN